MKKIFLLLALVTLVCTQNVIAQQTDVVPNANATTVGTASFAGPLSNSARTYQLLINQNQLTNLVGRQITGITFRLLTSASSAFPAADATYTNYDIYLGEGVAPANRSLTSFAANAVGTQTQVRSGSLTITAASFPSGGNPNGFGSVITFTTPFLYLGGHLLVDIRQSGSSGGSASTDAVSSGTDVSACWAGNYAGTGTPSNGNFSVIQFTSQSASPCTAPPTAGTATASTTVICPGNNVNLNLTGNSYGQSQTYTWQSSTNLTPPHTWTNVSSSSSLTAFSVNPTTTTFYRAAVTCSGSTTYSDSIKVLVNPAFPGNTYTINNLQPTGGLNFNNFTDAFNAINCGVSGKTTFLVSANQIFNENPPELNGSGTITDSIIFRKSGAGSNPVIQPVTPGTIASSTTLGANGDAVITINGGDYISFDRIDINTTNFTSGNDLFEYGYYLKKRSATDACKHVTIKNSVITLSKGIYSFGIHVSNNSGTAAVTVTAAGGVSDDIRISGNTISGVYGGIYVRGDATATYYDQNISIGVDSANTITDFGGGGSTAYGIYAIGQNNLKIANNTVISAGSGQTTTMYGIYTGTATNASNDIYNNTITINGGGTTSSIYGISNNAGGTGTNNLVRIYNNKLLSSTYTTATTGSLYLVEQAATAYNVEIYGNELTGNKTSPTTTGSFYMIYQSAAVVNQSKIYSNIIQSNEKTTGTTGTTYCIYNTGASTSNNLIYNNTISDINVTNTSGSVTGIHVITGATNGVYNNKILSIQNMASTTGPVYGITLASGGVINNVYNNIITGLTAPTSTNTGTTTTDHIRGINITSTTASSSNNISFNTIFLSATGGSIFSASCIYQTTSATATTAALYLRNNILVNHSTASGVGVVTALRLSSTTLTNYNTASGNNLMYVNPGSTHYLFYDGTNGDATLSAFKSRVTPRESSSVSEDPVFVNNGSLPYDLHINALVPSQAESGGITISGITTDIDGDTRNASTPDIGADEFAGVAADLTGPSISYTALPIESICLSSKTLSATITDASGVNVNAGTKPRLWFKKASENDALPATNTSASNGWKYVEATNSTSPFTFNFDFTLLTSALNYGDSVSYFVVAQDISPAANIGVNTATFSNTPSSVALSASSFPVSGGIKGFKVITQPNPIAIKVDRSELCVSGSVTLNVDGVNVTGATYQWQSSPTGLNNFSDIGAATTVPYTTSTFNQSTDFRLVVKCNATPIASSPSPLVPVTVNNPQLTSTLPGYRCGPGTVNLKATAAAGDIKWYAGSTGGSALYTGNVFTTPSISTTTTYYAAVSNGGGGNTSVGPLTSPSTDGYTGLAGLNFDAAVPFTLTGVYVYPLGTGTGDVVIALQDAAQANLQQVTVNLTGTASPGVKTYVPLNFNVPAGTGLSLMMLSRSGNVASLKRDLSATTVGGFPFTLPGVVSLTQGRLGAGGNATVYYFFYDWQISTSCEGTRTAVVATVNNDPGCVPLPVSLLSFKGDKVGSSNRLMWTTATEINNNGFELQRSVDGINFSSIGFVASKAPDGNSTINLSYEYKDVAPPAGTVYYRLKQMDKDGKYTHSSTVALTRTLGNEISVIALYPNPANDILNLKVQNPYATKARVTINDAAGRIIMQQQTTFITGENVIKLPIQQLVTGTYFIKVVTNDGITTSVYKFMKN